MLTKIQKIKKQRALRVRLKKVYQLLHKYQNEERRIIVMIDRLD